MIKIFNFQIFWLLILGLNFALRKIANASSPTIQLTKDEEFFVFNTYSTFKNVTLKFKLDEEFSEVKHDGRKIPSVMSMKENKLILNQKDGEKTIETVRTFTKDECLTQISVDGVLRCTRWFKLVS